ncbi:MAG: hypothetical protein U0359_14340 [Byssovorax sp.]
MKPALVLTLASSLTCLAAWDAEAKPAEVHPSKAEKVAHQHGDKADKPAHHGKHEPKRVAKAKDAPKAHAEKGAHPAAKVEKAHEVLPPVAWKIGDGGGITLQAKVSAPVAPHPLASPAHFHAEVKAKAGVEGKGAPAAKKAPLKKSFWIAAEPHVPLAVVDAGVIHGVTPGPKTCGAEKRWARPKSHWRAVDEWGQVTGSFEVQKSLPFEDKSCREVFFKGQPASQPPVLLVSEDSGWKPGASAAWTPSEQEARHFERMASAVDELWVNGKPKGKVAPLAQRTLFFQMASGESKRPTHWAVAGGPVLMVAYLGEHGHWKMAEVKSPLGKGDAYKPIGVFDMNGDGMPDIVYHVSDGPNAADGVLSLDAASMSWIDAAMSPGGATR